MAHHVVPESKGGTRTLPLCGPCHGLVHDAPLAEIDRLRRDGIRKRIEENGQSGGNPRFGYKRLRGGTYEPCQAEQRTMVLIDRYRSEGMTWADICHKLNTGGRLHRGKQWNYWSAWRMWKRYRESLVDDVSDS